MTDKYCIGYCNVETESEARDIALFLLEEKLAACVNIMPAMHSEYWWEGKIETATEHQLVIKTTVALQEKVIYAIKDKHSYALPEVIFVPIIGGDPDYLLWIGEVTE